MSTKPKAARTTAHEADPTQGASNWLHCAHHHERYARLATAILDVDYETVTAPVVARSFVSGLDDVPKHEHTLHH